MNKQYKVKSHKKTERRFTPANNIAEFIDVMRGHGDKKLFAWKEKNVTREMTYAEFVAMVENFSLALTKKYGESAGIKVSVIGETSPYWIAAYLGILASGNVVVPMDKELDRGEISKFFEVADVEAVVYSATFNEAMANMLTGHKSLRTLIPLDDSLEVSDSVIPFSAMVSLGYLSGIEFNPDRDTERCCELLFTSGTTGTSKCVMLCQRNIFSVVNSACETVDFVPEDVLVSVLPLHHTYELACTLGALNYGMLICINDSLRHVLRNFKEYKPTGLVLVPLFVTTMYKKILAEANKSGKGKVLPVASKVANFLRFAGIDTSELLFRDVRAAFGGRLHKIICGGAAMNPELIPIFESFGISIYEGYGITECAPLVAVTPYYKRKCGSVGPAVPCCEVRIEGLETNEDGYVTGEIQVKGDNVMLGYMDPAANAAAFTDDGWFKTGDIGHMDNDGYIYITGRLKSVIVLENGKNVFPEEIEEYLDAIDEIEESVVIGREAEDGTVKLVAVVYPASESFPEKSEEELRATIQKAVAELNKKNPSFKQIHKLEFRKTPFEKTTTKKIKRHLVK